MPTIGVPTIMADSIIYICIWFFCQKIGYKISYNFIKNWLKLIKLTGYYGHYIITLDKNTNLAIISIGIYFWNLLKFYGFFNKVNFSKLLFFQLIRDHSGNKLFNYLFDFFYKLLINHFSTESKSKIIQYAIKCIKIY